MDFAAWLTSWLMRHPLKEPPERHDARYTAEVMAKVKALAQPTAAPSPLHLWRPWPRLALAVATAAVVLTVIVHSNNSRHQLAEELSRESQLLAALEESGLEPFEDDPDALAQELRTMDALTLAEAPPSDEQWLAQTLQLLEQLDEDLPENASGASSSDEWFEELRTLDESELAASS